MMHRKRKSRPDAEAIFGTFRSTNLSCVRCRGYAGTGLIDGVIEQSALPDTALASMHFITSGEIDASVDKFEVPVQQVDEPAMPSNPIRDPTWHPGHQLYRAYSPKYERWYVAKYTPGKQDNDTQAKLSLMCHKGQGWKFLWWLEADDKRIGDTVMGPVLGDPLIRLGRDSKSQSELPTISSSSVKGDLSQPFEGDNDQQTKWQAAPKPSVHWSADPASASHKKKSEERLNDNKPPKGGKARSKKINLSGPLFYWLNFDALSTKKRLS